MDDQEQFLTEALQKTVIMINTIDELYRETAFPIILQAFIGTARSVKGGLMPGVGREEILRPQIPPSMSVNEFFRKAAPSTHSGRFVCAAYYLLHTGKAEHFTQADILEIYGKLRQPKPRNSSDVMNQCIRKTYIIDAPDSSNKQKYWVITPGGEKYVEGLMNGNTSGND